MNHLVARVVLTDGGILLHAFHSYHRRQRSNGELKSRMTMIDGIMPLQLLIILVVALLVLGPGKLPETGRPLARRSATSDTG